MQFCQAGHEPSSPVLSALLCRQHISLLVCESRPAVRRWGKEGWGGDTFKMAASALRLWIELSGLLVKARTKGHLVSDKQTSLGATQVWGCCTCFTTLCHAHA